jgi:hypothetical protein
LCKIRTVNIDEPVEIHELCEAGLSAASDLKARYESALHAFEREDFVSAQTILHQLQSHHPDDLPSHRLQERLAQAIRHEQTFDPVWTLDGK